MPSARLGITAGGLRMLFALCVTIAVLGAIGSGRAAAPLPLTLESGWHGSVTSNGRVDITGPHDARGTVWPFLVPTTLSDQGAAAALLALLRQYYSGDATWNAPKVRATGTLVASGTGKGRRSVAILRYLRVGSATVATLYTASSNTASANGQQPAFARMFATFHPSGTGTSGSTAPNLSYVSWRDPAEGAFTIDVPRGWSVKGGIVRYTSVDVRTGVRIASTALDAAVLFGDASVPTYVEMNQALAMAGYHEGQVYTSPYGVKEVILAYQPGLAFAEKYAAALADANGCSDVQMQSQRDRADTVAALNRINAQFGLVGANVRNDAGEVAFTCRIKGKLYDAYVFAGTTDVQANIQSLWQVPYLYVATAQPSSMSIALAALQHIVGSFKQDPSWTARQSQLSADSARIASAAGSAIADSISSSYWSKSASEDVLSEQRSDATLGLTNTVDPATGEPFKVQSDSSHYWIDHSGKIVGTDTSAAPSVERFLL